MDRALQVDGTDVPIHVLDVNQARTYDWRENLEQICMVWLGPSELSPGQRVIGVFYDSPSYEKQNPKRLIKVGPTYEQEPLRDTVDTIKNLMHASDIRFASVESDPHNTVALIPFAHVLKVCISKQKTKVTTCCATTKYTPYDGCTIDNAKDMEKLLRHWRSFRKDQKRAAEEVPKGNSSARSKKANTSNTE